MRIYKTTKISAAFSVAILFASVFVSCNAESDATKGDVSGNSSESNKESRSDGELAAGTSLPGPSRDKNAGPSKAECEGVDTGDKRVLRNQTFPVDFSPFKNSCFVTYHDVDQDEPPIGSEFAIFRDGKMIYDFDDSRYSPDAATCWVEAVSFQDLNRDELTDIIIIGKCGAKSGPIIGNEVYLNTGNGFRTDTSANDSLEDFETVRDVAGFVSRNLSMFEE